MSRFDEILATFPETPRASVVNDAIQETLHAQHGVIARSQLYAFGLDAKKLLRRQANKLLYEVPVGRGNFTGQAGPVSIEGRRRAALLWAPEESWLTGASGAATLGLERAQDHIVHLICHDDAAGRKRAPNVVLHRTSILPAEDLRVVSDWPCTDVARSLMHLAPDANVRRMTNAIKQAEALRLYDHLSMHRVLESHRGLAGSPVFAAALKKVDDDSDRARSRFEEKTVELIHTSPQLPAVALNAVIEGVESDIWFPGTRGVIECDGKQFHRTAAQILRDAERERILLAAGFQILRLLWDQVIYRREETLRRIVAFYLANLEAPDPRRLAGRLYTA